MNEIRKEYQPNDLCVHGNRINICPDCQAELETHIETKRLLVDVLKNKQEQSSAKSALEKLERMDTEEVSKALEQAALYVVDNMHMDQFLHGGDFVGVGGQMRNRRILSLDVPHMLDVYPFLRYVVLKHVKDTAENRREIKIHKQIQEKLKQESAPFFSVPLMMEELSLPEGYLGVIVERLPKTETDASLQTMCENGKRERLAVRISDDIAAEIERAFGAMHEMGFLHGDINDGNIYLRNVQFRDFVLPTSFLKPRPKTRLLLSADITLLDFERTQIIIPEDDDEIIDKEDGQIEKMVESVMLDVGPDPNLEDVIAANDEFFGRRAA